MIHDTPQNSCKLHICSLTRFLSALPVDCIILGDLFPIAKRKDREPFLRQCCLCSNGLASWVYYASPRRIKKSKQWRITLTTPKTTMRRSMTSTVRHLKPTMKMCRRSMPSTRVRNLLTSHRTITEASQSVTAVALHDSTGVPVATPKSCAIFHASAFAVF
jgi:hypothetical protein